MCRPYFLQALQATSALPRSWQDFCGRVSYIESIRRLRPGRAFRLPDSHWTQTEFVARKHIGRLVVVPDSSSVRRGAAYAGV